MKRFFTSVLLTAGASLAAHLYRKRQSPIAFAEETVDYVRAKKKALADVNQRQKNVRKRLSAFESELEKAQPVIDDLSKSADRFQFKIQPHLDVINQRLNHLNQETPKD